MYVFTFIPKGRYMSRRGPERGEELMSEPPLSPSMQAPAFFGSRATRHRPAPAPITRHRPMRKKTTG